MIYQKCAMTVNRSPRRRRLASAVLAACVLYVTTSLAVILISPGDEAAGRRSLRSSDADFPGTGMLSVRERIGNLIARLRSGSGSIDPAEIGALKDSLSVELGLSSSEGVVPVDDASADEDDGDIERNAPAFSGGPTLSSRGAGPELAGFDGRTHRFHENSFPAQGVPWYAALSSPRLTWHVAPYRWNSCPKGENTYLGDTGFSFNIPDPDHPEDADLATSKHLRFRIERRSERECLWNYSKSCLAGGSFVMNLGKTARDMLYPGDYTLKTPEGTIRVVAYNTNSYCSIRDDVVDAPPMKRKELDRKPLAYLRQVKLSTVNPEGCQTWMEQRVAAKDLFAFNSDLATVHVDAPWMQAVIQVRQNKVATEESCINANMNVWVANVSPDVLGDEVDGMLGGGSQSEEGAEMGRRLKLEEAEQHRVDGPFSF